MSRLNHIKRHTIQSLREFNLFYDEPVVNHLTDWSYPNHFFSYFKKESTKLVVMLQGAINRSKMQPPIFQRWSWSEEINASVLILNDPTLFGNQLRIGWWQGCEEQYAIPSAAEFIKLVIHKLGYSSNDLLFFGSSAGGFSALMMAGHLKGSLAIVNNPQTNILAFREEDVQAFLQTKFGDISKKEGFSRYAIRFSASEWFKSIHYMPKIVYYQNVKDPFHFDKHYLPFVQTLYQSALDPNEFQSILYADDKGHYPLPAAKTVSIINDWVAKLSELEQKIKPEKVFKHANLPIPFASNQ